MTQIDLGVLMGRVIAELYVAPEAAALGVNQYGTTIKGSKEAGDPRMAGGAFSVRPSDGSEPRASRSWRWYERRFNQAHDDDTRRQLIREALDDLTSLRIAQRLAVDMQTEEGRLAIGRDTRPVHVVAAQYGYTVGHVRHLRRLAAAHDEREREHRDRELYDGTLYMRTMIAAEPGGARDVAARYGVAHTTVLRWRRDESARAQGEWEAADGETADWFSDEEVEH